MILVQVQLFETDIRYGLEVLHQWDKRVKLKLRKFLRLISIFVEVTEGKTGRIIISSRNMVNIPPFQLNY